MPPYAPVIPAKITVHLGRPQSNAENVTVSFVNYIKNVASSEIYPTWPENALRANIYAQISFALNRVYTEYYRSRGYAFDITNSTAYDQSFVKNRDIFSNISRIVDEIFNSYIVRDVNIEPLFAQYCNGTTVTCNGLSQWGSVDLANRGYTPYRILQYYYGNDINIITNVPVQNITASAPLTPLRRGSVGNAVKSIQIRLNRISKNYPSIPKITSPDGIFGSQTETAVKAFQRIFDLTPDGIVGNATWYAITRIYNAVKKLNELNSEGLTLQDIPTQYPTVLRRGDRGEYIRLLQYLIDYIATYDNTVPSIAVDGIFGPATENAVKAIQRNYGLTQDGIVGRFTWKVIYDQYLGITRSLPRSAYNNTPVAYPGVTLSAGSTGDNVRILQEYFNILSDVYTEITPIPVTGVFGTLTARNISAFQGLFDLPQTGTVDRTTWDEIANTATSLLDGRIRSDGQFGA